MTHISVKKNTFTTHNSNEKRFTFICALIYLLLFSLLTACGQGGNGKPLTSDSNKEEKLTAALGDSITLDGREKSNLNSDSATYNWEIIEAPEGSALVELNDPSSITSIFTPDIEGTYQLSLVVSDGAIEIETILITITVENSLSNINIPQANAGEDFATLIGSEIFLNGSGTFNSDVEYQWQWQIKSVPENSTVNIDTLSNANIANPSFVPDVPGDYIFSLTVINNSAISTPNEIKISVLENNTPPVANAGENKSVTTNTLVTLNAAKSFDPDGNQLSYSWAITTSPKVTNIILQQTTSKTLNFVPDVDGIYELSLTVSDGIDSNTATIIITATSSVEIPNNPPVANTGSNQEVLVNQKVFLDGSGSSDADGDPLIYTWSMIAPFGSSAVLENAMSEHPNFTPDIDGDYEISLSVYDGTNNSESIDTVIVTAKTPNLAPIVVAGPNQFIVVNDTVYLDGSGSHDPEGNEIFYAWEIIESPTDSSAMLTDVASAKTMFTPEIAGEYIVTLIVSDGKKTSQVSTVITVAGTAEGSKSEPKRLSYTTPSTFPYAGNVQKISNYYQVDDLDSNTYYHIYLTELDNNVDLVVYGDSSFTNIICESHNSLTRHENCISKATEINSSLFIEVNGNLATNNAQYTLNITPAVDEGSRSAPKEISLNTPYLGTARSNASFYEIKIVRDGDYVISLKDQTGDLKLDTAFSSSFLKKYCGITSVNLNNMLCDLDVYARTSFYIRVTHKAGDIGTSFEIFVTEGHAVKNEGTDDSPIPLTYSGSLLQHTTGKVDTNKSYYQLTGLTVGADYDVWLPALNNNVYLEIQDESGITISDKNFPKQFTFKASTSTVNIRVHGDESEMGSDFTLSVQENKVQPQREGMISDPRVLAYDTVSDSLSHTGSVDTTNSYYEIINLPTNRKMIFSITDLSHDADLSIYSDSGYSNLICESSLFNLNDDYCSYSLLPPNSSLYVKINGSKTWKGTQFNLTVAPPLFESEGNIDIPLELDASVITSSGHEGAVDKGFSYYRIDNLLSDYPYEIRLEQPSGDVDLYVYTSGFSSPNCLSENWDDLAIEYCVVTTNSTSLFVKVSGGWSTSGAKFILKAIEK